jgi:hypothetical protein
MTENWPRTATTATIRDRLKAKSWNSLHVARIKGSAASGYVIEHRQAITISSESWVGCHCAVITMNDNGLQPQAIL